MTANNRKIFSAVAILMAALLTARASANVKLPALFSDHMLLQQDMPVKVWGWANAGEKVIVSLAGQTASTAADPDGKWTVTLNPLHAGGPLTLSVQGNNTLTVNDVLVGEVWIASGQSNMTLSVRACLNWQAEAAASEDPQLRMFAVPGKSRLEPQQDVDAHWEAASPDAVPGWTAAGYYFGRELRRKLGVPVGIIHSSYGGTPGEAWTSLAALNNDPELKKQAAEQIDQLHRYPAEMEAYPGLLATWMNQHGAQDPGAPATPPDWTRPGYDDSAWPHVQVPAFLDQMGLQGGGIVWLRKSFKIDSKAPANDFDMDALWLNDAGTVYVNGVQIPEQPEVKKFFGQQYRFHIPGALLQPGKETVVAFRIHGLTQHGNLGSRTRELKLPGIDPKDDNNTWAYHVEKAFPPLTSADVSSLPAPPQGGHAEHTAGCLFNAMINPLIPYGIRGAIWYQGESNVSRAQQYKTLLTLLINDWRTRWGEGDFPFLIEQLANYDEPQEKPGESDVAALREAQLQVSQTVPNTGLAVAIDIGEVDIHPKDKQDVGRRLALLALGKAYAKEVVDSGPIYKSMQVEQNQIRIKFTHADGGLVAKGGPLQRFAIAGADNRFVWADARIDGDSVVVSSPQVASPVAVRYAWASNPQGANLYNGAGLPASPFRTDTP